MDKQIKTIKKEDEKDQEKNQQKSLQIHINSVSCF